MQISNTILMLSSLVGLLAAIAAGFGLFLRNDGSPFTFTTLRGQQVQINAQGLYRYDTLFFGAGFRSG